MRFNDCHVVRHHLTNGEDKRIAVMFDMAPQLIYVGPFVDTAAQAADVALPTAAWAEEDGTTVNFEGRVQRLQRCHLPRGEGRPGWMVARELAAAGGAELPAWGSAAEVLESLAGDVGEYAGMTERSIGLLGAGEPA